MVCGGGGGGIYGGNNSGNDDETTTYEFIGKVLKVVPGCWLAHIRCAKIQAKTRLRLAFYARSARRCDNGNEVGALFALQFELNTASLN